MQRSTVLTLLLVCSVAAVAWVAWSQAYTPVALPTDVGDGDERVGVSDGGTDATDGSQLPSVDVAPDAPLVTITVAPKERFVPPPDGGLAMAGDGTPLPARVLAGIGSGFDARIERPGVSLLQIDWRGGSTLLRQLAVQPRQPRPAHIGARVVVRGRVVDADRKPLTTARVWFGESLADGSRSDYGVDDDGAFEAEVPAGDGIPFVVQAPGHASAWRAISVTPTSGELSMQLLPATTVRVQLAARAFEIERARAYVLPASTVTSGLSQWPFFLQCLGDGYPVDADGRVQIDDLPRHGEVGIVVRHPFAPLANAKPVRLEERAVQAVVPLQFTDRQRRSLVVDEHGEGLADVSVWLRERAEPLAKRASLRLLPPHLDQRGSCHALTDRQGAFAIGAPSGSRSLSLRAHGRAGRDVSIAAVWPEQVVLPRWRGGDAVMHVQPPLDGSTWRFASNLGEGISGGCEPDQPCSLSLPYAGVFDITITVAAGDDETFRSNLNDEMVTGPFDVVTR